MTDIVIIVEGINDKKRLAKLLSAEIEIICTYGTLSNAKLEKLKQNIRNKELFIFTDNDASGKKIRAILKDTFPDGEQIYTKKGYAGVEGTPDEYLIQQLEKAGLEAYIRYPDQNPLKSLIDKSQS